MFLDQDQKLEQLGIHLKEEQQNRKTLQKQVETLTETLNDVTAERDGLDKVTLTLCHVTFRYFIL